MKRIEAVNHSPDFGYVQSSAPKSRLSFTLLASHSCEVAEGSERHPIASRLLNRPLSSDS